MLEDVKESKNKLTFFKLHFLILLVKYVFEETLNISSVAKR